MCQVLHQFWAMFISNMLIIYMIVIHAPNCKIKILLKLGWAMRTCRTFKRMTHHAPMNCVPYMSTTTLLSFNMKKNPWFCCIMKHNLNVLIGDKLHQNIASKKFFNLLLFISNIFGLQYFLQNHNHFKKIKN
jgi:hypothetical protein